MTICDICKGQGTLLSGTGDTVTCPFCAGTRTNSWRLAETQRQAKQTRWGRLGAWAAIGFVFMLSFNYIQTDHTSTNAGFWLTLVAWLASIVCIGLAVRLYRTRNRRPRPRGLNGGGEWLALGGLGFWAARRAFRHTSTDRSSWPKFPQASA